MATNWLDVARTVLALIIVSALMGLITALWSLPRMVRRLAKAVSEGKATHTEAREVYRRRSVETLQAARYPFLVVLAIAVVTPWTSSDIQAILPPLPIALLVATAALCECVWNLVYASVSDRVTLSATFATIRGRPLNTHAVRSYRFKFRLPRYSAMLALFWIGALLYGLQELELLWLIPLIALLIFVVHSALRVRDIRWLYPTTPLEQTRWAHLAPRIKAWATYAGVSIGAIQVLDLQGLGTAGAIATGRRTPTFFIAESFLAAADWRQFDALTNMVLDSLRRRREAFVTKCMWALGEGAIIGALFLVFAYAEGGGAGNLGPILPIGVILITVPISHYALYQLLVGYNFPRYSQLADRFAASQTGDPLAAMVALVTVSAPYGSPISRIALRLNLLDRQREQPGHWAPWADLPVPSGVTFTWQKTLLTAPLETAPLPAPVPTAPYPERGPVLIAAEASRV